MKIIVPSPLIFLLTFIAGLILQNYAPFAVFPAGKLITIFAALLFAIGGFIAVWALKTMRDAKISANPYTPTSQLTFAGPYQYSRNPMYLSLAILYLAVALWLNNLWLFILFIPMLVIVWWTVIRLEEIYLEGLFGEQYSGYKKRVRRWL